MAISLPSEQIPAQTLHPERRTWRLQIECPLDGDPFIQAFRQVVKRDDNGGVVDIGLLNTGDSVSAKASDFMRLCPQYAHLVADVAAAIDALEQALAPLEIT